MINRVYSAKFQLAIIVLMIFSNILVFAVLLEEQRNLDFIKHNYLQSKVNFDFISYLNDTIHTLILNDTNSSAVFYNDHHIIANTSSFPSTINATNITQ